VLRRTAGLEEQEVCTVLGVPLSRLRDLLATEPPEADEPDGGTVLPLPYARVHLAVARARRRSVLVASGVVAVSLMVAGLGYLLTRPEPLLGPGNALPSAATFARENAADVVWWADGTLHLAGATVLRGPMGFGAHSRLHTAKILRLSEDLPIVIEIVDSRENIDRLMPHIDEMVIEGLVTLEDVEVIKYRAGKSIDA